MSSVRGRRTKPEQRIAAALGARSAGWEGEAPELPGKPDFVHRRSEVAVFVHGCFWHRHDCRRGLSMPTANRDFWAAKLAANQSRDAPVADALAARGWRVVAVWECEAVSKARLAAVLQVRLDA